MAIQEKKANDEPQVEEILSYVLVDKLLRATPPPEPLAVGQVRAALWTTVYRARMDYYRKRQRRRDHEIPVSALGDEDDDEASLLESGEDWFAFQRQWFGWLDLDQQRDGSQILAPSEDGSSAVSCIFNYIGDAVVPQILSTEASQQRMRAHLDQLRAIAVGELSYDAIVEALVASEEFDDEQEEAAERRRQRDRLQQAHSRARKRLFDWLDEHGTKQLSRFDRLLVHHATVFLFERNVHD
ncbi:MAG: hypothetical protein ACOC9J_01195 [Persicimonas sp.]